MDCLTNIVYKPGLCCHCGNIFSILKLKENYLRSTMSQERFNGLSMISIESLVNLATKRL